MILKSRLCYSLILFCPIAAPALAERPQWAGQGEYRMLVRVEPVALSGRAADELPAQLQIDFAAELRKMGVKTRPDIASLQVTRYDPVTGRAQDYADYAYGRAPADRPFRWYDAAIPYDFPEFHDAITRSGGRIVRRGKVRGGYFLNVLGDWQAGHLAWMHTQSAEEPAHYAIYFNLLDAEQKPSQLPPRGWLGDGLPRCDHVGRTTLGADHCRVDVADWDGDGLVDLIVGEHYGHVLWLPNVGSREQPQYRYCRFVQDAGQLPVDAGMAAAPKVVDWDGDGRQDLLVGTEWNRVLFYRNVGEDRGGRLEYRGFVLADGVPLELPVRPLARGSSDVFRRDYYPVLETVDWDGDGDIDLLAGGYITGRVYFYENGGRADDGTPRLRLQGPLEADGSPLNVGYWCAAPCAADFDGDGDLDLMSGNMPMYARGEELAAAAPLVYYENVGTPRDPQLRQRPAPLVGPVPRINLATPRALDWDDDGDLDLVISAREDIYLAENQGQPGQPRFAVASAPLAIPWGLAALSVDRLRDWDGDGRLDLISNYTVRLNSGAGNPYRWETAIGVLPPGLIIEHPSGTGDDWFWPYLDDFDSDGEIDVLFGDWFGHVWFHRNLSTTGRLEFDTQGFRLQLNDGAPLKVGPIGLDPDKDFNALQGARTVFTVADFDRDGLRDLVVGDTYGKVRYFRNVGSEQQPRFAEPIEIGDLGIRLLVDATDWDGDGWTDVIAGAANGKVRVLLNRQGDGTQPFADGFDPQLPPILQPRVLMGDLNGDGDEDLLLPSTQGSCWVERSFLKHGYARGELLGVERRSSAAGR